MAKLKFPLLFKDLSLSKVLRLRFVTIKVNDKLKGFPFREILFHKSQQLIGQNVTTHNHITSSLKPITLNVNKHNITVRHKVN